MILAIDPGTKESAYVGLQTDYSIITAAKIPNQKVLEMIALGAYEVMVIECMEPRTLNISKSRVNAPPQRIGDETYETCIWIGRFMEAAYRCGMDVHRVVRSEERRMLVPSRKNNLPPLPEPVPKSVDAQIRAALVQRFAKHDKVNGKGRKNCRDVFYGFKADMWNAYAIGVVFLDKWKNMCA